MASVATKAEAKPPTSSSTSTPTPRRRGRPSKADMAERARIEAAKKQSTIDSTVAGEVSIVGPETNVPATPKEASPVVGGKPETRGNKLKKSSATNGETATNRVKPKKSSRIANGSKEKNNPPAADEEAKIDETKPKNTKKRIASGAMDNPELKRKRGRPSNADKALRLAAEEAKKSEGASSDSNRDIEMSCVPDSAEAKNGNTEHVKQDKQADEPKSVEAMNEVVSMINAEHEKKNAFDEVKSGAADAHKSIKKEQEQTTKSITANKDSVIEDEKREAEIPSSILEKGVFYCFYRSRVNTENPEGINDVATSYIVLRPIPLGAKIGHGPLQDDGKARLVRLPKKILPSNKRDRFLSFVEKSGLNIKDLRDQLSSKEYATKTVGTSKIPSATPFAEGIYAINSTGSASHLAYHITVPSSFGDLQAEFGLKSKGSFVVSAKNPQVSAPTSASLPKGADYPDSIQSKFRGLRWMPLIPELLEYENTQFLLIGEGMSDVSSAVKELKKDAENPAVVTPADELQKLEEEDHDRVEGLKEDDPIFADLGMIAKEFENLATSW